TFGPIVARGREYGERIGTGYGAFRYGDPGRAIELSTTRQINALAEAGEIRPGWEAQPTVDQIGAERGRAIFGGLQENVEYVREIGDGVLASVELGADVYTTVEGGLALKALASRSAKVGVHATRASVIID